ncbi:NAD(P)-bd-dom domain-containing protein [Fusarium keratoplasticum]|uniref:NAD(P)-bd-dom domain-containing protein n=1 Tax=Fusarium keratoplasticum TaxID=1328300 RepID=A0ACC0R4E4_9HYPO|nr:NAD(P)-bd-dom domain-containing protein [Fusarium keratoplasticum]KAI8674968.1 NAD(P)-bd-dom domain-containing protein [Fusarium keratoplasticum]KAI8681429.1 NAD(P)-bd-dom domain-containing protein [Fusarium keratoplasticum]
MATTPPSAAIIGSTGLVGGHILSTLLAVETFTPVHTITRRAPKAESPRLDAVVDADTSKWAGLLSGFAPTPSVVFSALGTTRAAAGGLANQWKIDHDLNVELVKAAKAAGTGTFVFISSAGTRGFPSSMAPYSKMKNGVEDAIKEQDFQQAVILKPGMILGHREQGRALEGIFQGAVNGIGKLSTAVKDAVGQDAEVIGRAAVKAAQLAAEGKAPSKYWVIEAADIVRLGRTEWAGKEKAEEEVKAQA